MYEEPRSEVSKDDVARVAGKLASLMEELPEEEQNVLGLILARAATANSEDIRGFEFGVEDLTRAAEPFAGQLARSAGLFAKPEVTVIVGWPFKFGRLEGNPAVLPAAAAQATATRRLLARKAGLEDQPGS